MVVVFPLRSTPALASQAAAASRALVSRIAAIDGYDARGLENPKGGGLGASAAAVGAEIYIVGQLVSADSGYNLTLGSFSSATDRSIGEYQVSLANPASLPDQPNIRSLLEAAPPSQPSPTASEPGNLITLPTGTPLEVRLDAPISSGSAKVGDKFAFQSSVDVSVDGVVVIAKGSQGEGEVALAEAAGSNGHPGKLGLQFDWIAAVDGSKVALSDTQHADEGEQKKGAASTATIASYVLLGPLGLFAHNFVRGRDITLDDKTKLKAYVDHTVHVASQVKEAVPPGFAH